VFARRRRRVAARVDRVDDGGHALHVTHPEAVATAIELAFEAAAKAGEPAAPPVPIRPSSGPATPLANEAVA